MAAKKDEAYERVRAICLSLPDTKETITWGKPHFRVMDKIFAGYGEENGKRVVGFKLAMHHAKAVVTDRRFSPAPYVGHKGWVSMDAGAATRPVAKKVKKSAATRPAATKVAKKPAASPVGPSHRTSAVPSKPRSRFAGAGRRRPVRRSLLRLP